MLTVIVGNYDHPTDTSDSIVALKLSARRPHWPLATSQQLMLEGDTSRLAFRVVLTGSRIWSRAFLCLHGLGVIAIKLPFKVHTFQGTGPLHWTTPQQPLGVPSPRIYIFSALQRWGALRRLESATLEVRAGRPQRLTDFAEALKPC